MARDLTKQECVKCEVEESTLIAPVWEPILEAIQLLADGQTTATVTNNGASLAFNGGNIFFGFSSTMVITFDNPIDIRISSANDNYGSLQVLGQVLGVQSYIKTDGSNWVYNNNSPNIIVSGNEINSTPGTQVFYQDFGVATSNGVTQLEFKGAANEVFLIEVMALQEHYEVTSECKPVCEVIESNTERIEILESASQNLTSTTRVIHSDEYEARSSNGTTQLFGRIASIDRTALGQWDVVFSTPHPDGVNYVPKFFAEEQSANRDTPDITVVQGSITANGFSIQITTGDNGGVADGYVDTPWGFTVSAPVTVLESVTLT